MALGKKKKDEAVSGPESAEVVDDSLAPQEEAEAQEEAADVLSDPVEDEAPVPSDPTDEVVIVIGSQEANDHRAADSVSAIDVADGHKAPDHRHGHHSGEAVEAAGVVIHPPSLLADVHKAQGV